MAIFHLVLLYPLYLLGWLIGYLYRPILRGYYMGFYYVELQERNRLTKQLTDIVAKMKEDE